MSNEILKSLISKGYFPEEIAPWFNSKTLSTKLPEVISNLGNCTERTSKCCRYTMPKGKLQRRVLSIPNPLHYIKLCKVMEENWTDLIKLVSSPISLTTPNVKKRSKRALSRKFKFSEITQKLVMSSTSSRYLLLTDISRYYSTIYTHSIPWAIHGKEVAKADRGNHLIGNLLDTLIRNCQDGQTIGIPIGPDSSLLIAEIICVAMDKRLLSEIHAKKVFRYIDNYYFFFESYSSAEKALAILHKIVSDFELELSPNKTKIIELPEPIEPLWLSELNKIPENNREITSYINKAYHYWKMYPDQEVLKYGLARLSEIYFKKPGWDLIESFILNTILHEPVALPLGTDMLVRYCYRPYGLSKRKAEETVFEIISYHSDYGHEYELTWALWLCNVLSLKIPESLVRKLCLIENSFVALAVLDLYTKGLIKHGVDLDKWKDMMTGEELYKENWLLAYEALVKGWLPSKDGSDYIGNDPFFKNLRDNKVEFYDKKSVSNWLDKKVNDKWLFGEMSPVF